MSRPKEFDPAVAVDAALDLFWRQGYGATTPQQLTEALGIGKGSLYNAFGSKRALFELALDRYLDNRIAATKQLLEADGSVKEILRAALDELVQSNFGTPAKRGCLATNSAVEIGCDDEAVARTVRALYANTEGAFRALIERGQRDGDLRPDIDAEATASMLLNAITGMEVLSLVDDTPGRLRRVIDATLEML